MTLLSSPFGKGQGSSFLNYILSKMLSSQIADIVSVAGKSISEMKKILSFNIGGIMLDDASLS